jgi:2-oxoglutarate ferredoxin oxidoreductase subunit beta
MTGGQYSPTTPFTALSTTSRYGNIEQPFDICELAIGSGATFVARSTTYQALLLDRLIEKAIRKKGFSVVEAISNCNTAYGRTNRLGSAVDMMKWEKECGVMVDAWEKMTTEERKGKFAIGLLKDIERPEYTEEFDKITRESQNITA